MSLIGLNREVLAGGGGSPTELGLGVVFENELNVLEYDLYSFVVLLGLVGMVAEMVGNGLNKLVLTLVCCASF